MDAKHVLVTFAAGPGERALILEALANEAAVTFLSEVPPAERDLVLARAHVLLTRNFAREIHPEEYSRLRSVACVQFVSAGVDHQPIADLPVHWLLASNAGGPHAEPMAEHVLAMTLALAKRLVVGNAKLQQGEFDQFTPTRVLNGMTGGILGFGGIGRATGRLMRAFGMRTYAINSTGRSPEAADFLGTLEGDLELVLRASDVVVLSLPLTKTTKGLIGEEQLSWMKPDAILVNVARGPIIDEAALFAHLKHHPGFLAGLDAWWTEPLHHGIFRMEYPFLDLPNVIGSPHNSAIAGKVLDQMVRGAAENVGRFLAGKPVSGIVRREDYM